MDVKKVTREHRLQHWIQIIKECHQSGKTVKGWCAQQGINVKSYYYWQKQIRESACNGLLVCQQTGKEAIAVTKPVFTELNLPETRRNAGTAVTIRFHEAVIEIQNGTDASVIENALRALKSLC